MIQFNLLPDVKLEYIKSQRTKKLVLLIATGVTLFSVFIASAMAAQVYIVQKKQIKSLDSQIATKTKKITSNDDLSRMLTIQNQLSTLTTLHSAKPGTSRLFGYLTQLIPLQVKVGSLSLNYDTSSLSLSGSTDSLQTINKFVDTLKFTTYTSDAQSESKKAFKSVVLSGYNRSDTAATYSVALVFEPDLFDTSKTITLGIVNQKTTRSFTEAPEANLYGGPTVPTNTIQKTGN